MNVSWLELAPQNSWHRCFKPTPLPDETRDKPDEPCGNGFELEAKRGNECDSREALLTISFEFDHIDYCRMVSGARLRSTFIGQVDRNKCRFTATFSIC